jgi:hypothetical protein
VVERSPLGPFEIARIDPHRSRRRGTHRWRGTWTIPIVGYPETSRRAGQAWD